jgi:hypothetical protein
MQLEHILPVVVRCVRGQGGWQLDHLDGRRVRALFGSVQASQTDVIGHRDTLRGPINHDAFLATSAGDLLQMLISRHVWFQTTLV